jgi:polysaccharide export outer membrane protein
VLGEVSRPGRINIQKDFFTILDAITYAGDLTIDGQRENVKVMREVDGEDQTFVINLCDRQDMLSSPAYYLQQNDVVYVEPNQIRIDNSKYNQNNAYKLTVISTIVSAASVIASLVIALAVK